jgi:hypothetical protein
VRSLRGETAASRSGIGVLLRHALRLKEERNSTASATRIESPSPVRLRVALVPVGVVSERDVDGADTLEELDGLSRTCHEREPHPASRLGEAEHDAHVITGPAESWSGAGELPAVPPVTVGVERLKTTGPGGLELQATTVPFCRCHVSKPSAPLEAEAKGTARRSRPGQ